MGHLNLALLGAPVISHDGKVVAFPTRKVLALLVYLVVEGGTHARAKIAALFWPESSDTQARATLRRTLAFLRQALDETAQTRTDSEQQAAHLVVDREWIGFNHAVVYELDLRTVAAAVTQTRAAATSPHLIPELLYAASLARGEFLEGFALNDAPAFDEWLTVQRTLWHGRVASIYERLSQLQSDAGQAADAIETAARWVAHDPLDEAAYRRLMQLHFAAGDRAAALQTYAHCQTRLAEDLAAAPAPETAALADQIRAAATPARPSVRQGRQPVIALEAPLVGRHGEHTQLVTAYHEICQQRPQVVTLEGEAGIGKSRLAAEFLAWTSAQGAALLRGRAFEASDRLPYQPVVDALRGPLEHENAPDDLLGDVWLAELSRILPELRERYPDLPEPITETTATPIRLFEAVTRLVAAWAARAPVILFVDDVQWADAASLDLLHYMGRRWAEIGAPVLMLLSLRAETLATLPTLLTWLGSLDHDLATMRIALSPLSESATLQLVKSLARAAPDGSGEEEAFGRWLFAETHGQPFYMLEMLKALLEQGILGTHRTGSNEWAIDFARAVQGQSSLQSFVPQRVRDVIRARLARLSPNALSLLAAGAVLHHGFTFEQVRHVAGVSEQEGLLALDSLLESRLLVEDRQAHLQPYAIAHDKIRDIVYTEAGDARRRIYHRRAFDLLLAEPAPAAELARHARAAGLAGSAFRHSLAAGDDAMHLSAVRDAIDHYARARQIVDEAPDPRTLLHEPARQLAHLYVQLGHAYQLSGELQQAGALYQAMLSLARTLGLLEMECAALNRLATFTAQMSLDMDQAASLLEQALEVAQRSGDKALVAETAWNLAQSDFYRWNGAASLAHGQQALELARELANQELVGRCLNVIAYAYTALGRWQECAATASEARALYAALRIQAMEADCLAQLAFAAINLGRPQEGVAAARAAYEISTRLENGWGQANAALYLAHGLLETGDYGEALAVARQGVAIARTIEHIPMLA
ncbi:MAG: AAA family ATPase, partial [Caldilineaceae bacterium]|nr:AAA family ATPase [Caldilineaceae bacterium]